MRYPRSILYAGVNHTIFAHRVFHQFVIPILAKTTRETSNGCAVDGCICLRHLTMAHTAWLWPHGKFTTDFYHQSLTIMGRLGCLLPIMVRTKGTRPFDYHHGGCSQLAFAITSNPNLVFTTMATLSWVQPVHLHHHGCAHHDSPIMEAIQWKWP